MKIRDRINTFLLDFKGDAAAFMLLQEAAEVLAYYEGLSAGFEHKSNEATAELEKYKADFQWLEKNPDGIGRADRDHDDGRNWGVFAEPKATWHCTIREAIAHARTLQP